MNALWASWFGGCVIRFDVGWYRRFPANCLVANEFGIDDPFVFGVH